LDKFNNINLTSSDLELAGDMYFEQRLFDDRGVFNMEEWIDADSPFHYKVKKTYSYDGKKHDNSSVNYLAIGMRSAHVGISKWVMDKLIKKWKNDRYEHDPSESDYYFADWGYDYYNNTYRPPVPRSPAWPLNPGLSVGW
jgi:hypothetical protein